MTFEEQGTGERRCGPYRLVRILSHGGMGSVYLAERADGEVAQRAAIKLLRYGAGDPAFQDRFLRERQILAALNHPGIARMLDAGHTSDGQPYLAMDYVDGVTIDAYTEKMDLRGKLALFLQVCEAVSYAHRNLIIHRDLKPSNILVDGTGQPRLLDFGIAMMLEGGQHQTQITQHLMTPEYASPEQFRGGAQTTATDVYSLGAILHRLLAGHSPGRPPARLDPGLPRDLDFVLGKTLREEPEERYPSVDAFADDLRAFLDGRPVRARSGDWWYRTRKFLRRRRLPVAAISVALAGLCLGLYVANRERLIAQGRFLQVRQLAKQFLELDKGLRGLSDTAQARNRVVSDALAYLAGLTAEVRGEPELALEIGTGYLQIARIQGVPTDSHLGQYAQADKNLRKADAFVDTALAADPGNHRGLLTSAQIAHDRMVLCLLQDRWQEALAQAERMAVRLSRLTGRGLLEPNEAREAAMLARFAAFARQYRDGAHSGMAVLQRQTGELAAWGYNGYGQLGNGSAGANAPAQVTGLSDVVAVAGGLHHSLALKSDGTVWSWGRNSYAEPGQGTHARQVVPARISSPHNVISIACGQLFNLALDAHGTVWEWDIGSLPHQVSGLSGVIAVAAGGGHSLALGADGTVWAWGYNSNGQLGVRNYSKVPVQIPGLSGVVAVAGGGAHSLAVRADGTVWAWGFNHVGQLGDGSNTDSYSPVQVRGLTGVIAVAGANHGSLALKSDGTVWAWGRNREGELGNGTNTATNLPVWVADLSGVVGISAAPVRGAGHNLALKSDGTVWAWGYNPYGELGSGSQTDSNVPVQVAGLQGATAIAAGGLHSLVVVCGQDTSHRRAPLFRPLPIR